MGRAYFGISQGVRPSILLPVTRFLPLSLSYIQHSGIQWRKYTFPVSVNQSQDATSLPRLTLRAADCKKSRTKRIVLMPSALNFSSHFAKRTFCSWVSASVVRLQISLQHSIGRGFGSSLIGFIKVPLRLIIESRPNLLEMKYFTS